jgi:hypothetical protein
MLPKSLRFFLFLPLTDATLSITFFPGLQRGFF